MLARGQNDAGRLDLWPNALIDELHGLLDIEAGLREVLLHSRHAAQLDGLAEVLDVEAGLGAILLAGGGGREEVPRPRREHAFPSIDAEERLALRQHPPVRTAHRLLTRALDHHHALGLDLHLARKLTCHVDRPQADRRRACVLAHQLVRHLHADRERADDLAQAIARCAGAGITAAHLAHALDHARELGLVLDLAHALERDLDGDLAGQLVRCLTRDLGGLHEGTRTLLAHALTWVLVAIRDRLGREVALSQETVCQFLDDFTTSDLRAVRLSDVELEGVRWSEAGTWWPDDVDVEHLRARSDVIGGGDGVLVIRSGAATVRDLAGH
ncbi:hypothetical protein AB0K12_28035 [Nonomuraea sp. NPDC049419]|uniref:hypothetical protein n=1 Tax=Nonomuraea sp. NPDC049419 TaxID=3155772 RepID=UPI00342D0537